MRLCCPECNKRVEACCCWEKETLVDCDDEDGFEEVED